jgi:dipeptidyl aminopeptidase/acylaminoacyl peptidase
MKTLCVFVLALLFASPSAGERRPFTIEDLYRIKSVGDPRFSPDGRRIAFCVTEYSLEEGKSNSDIYLMYADGSGLRQMTHHREGDFHARWSPDGRSLLFVSSRENGAQAWRLPADGGEAQQLTDLFAGVNDPIWAPDGKRIVFFTEVFPECGADDDCNKKLSEDIENGVVQAHLADNLLYRHWNFWKDGKRFHTFVYDIESGECTDLTPGNRDFPYYEVGGSSGFDVSPDGKELCVSANTDSNHWETTNKDLWIISTKGGVPVNITGENEAYDAHPRYAPDGRYIAYLMQKVPAYEADRFRLALYNRETGEKTVLTGDFDNWVRDFKWAPDSKNIYFTADVRGSQPIYRVDIKSGRIEKIIDLRTVDSFDISPDGKTLAASRRSVGEPQEIWHASTNGKSVKRLTTFNRGIEEEVDIRPAEEMWFDSPTGREIHTFVVKPHGFDPDEKYPLILNVHGGPQMQWTDGFRGDWQVYPGAGYIVAFPNPHGSTGYGQEFTHAISRDWGGRVYEDVMALADALAKIPWVDENRMGAMGWSYGGYMMAWLEGHTDRFKAIISMMGLYNLSSEYGSTEELWFPHYDLGGTPWDSEDYEKWSPHNYTNNFKTPCLVITGEQDFRVPYTQSLEFFTALQKKGVPSRLIVFKNDGHWPNWVGSMPLYYNAHLDWFHRYLGGDPAPYDVREMVRNRIFEKEGE